MGSREDMAELYSVGFPIKKFINLFVEVIAKQGFFCYNVGESPEFHRRILETFSDDIANSENVDRISISYRCIVYGDFNEHRVLYLLKNGFELLLETVIWKKSVELKSKLTTVPWCITRGMRMVYPVVTNGFDIMKTFHRLFSLKHLREYGKKVGASNRKLTISRSNPDYLFFYRGKKEVTDERAIFTRNKYTITMAIAVMCFKISNHPIDFYMNLRGELENIGSSMDTNVRNLRSVILYVLTNYKDLRIGDDFKCPSTLNGDWAKSFFWECMEFFGSPIRLHLFDNFEPYVFHRKSDIYIKNCNVPKSSLVPDRPQPHIRFEWPLSVATQKELLMSIQFWCDTLQLVRRKDIYFKSTSSNLDVTFLDISVQNVLRIQRYSPMFLHFRQYAHFDIAMYSHLCMNYLQAIVDSDYYGMRLVMASILSMVTNVEYVNLFLKSDLHLTDRTRNAICKFYGTLHGILGRFGNGIYWEALLYPYRNMDECDVYIKNLSTVDPDSFDAGDQEFTDPHIGFDASRKDGGVIRGFKIGSDNIYTAITAFVSIHEPHMIRVAAVDELYDLFRDYPHLNAMYPLQMNLIIELQNSLSSESKDHIAEYSWGSYIRIPDRITNDASNDQVVPSVVHLYNLLLAKEIDDIKSFNLFCSIRIFIKPQASRLSKTRMPPIRRNGLQTLLGLEKSPYMGLRETHRYHRQFYSKTEIPRNFDVMVRSMFFLEMLSYLPAEDFPFCDAEKQIKESPLIFDCNPCPPLSDNSYRGCMSSWHFYRYAYPLSTNEYHNHVDPLYVGDGKNQEMILPIISYRATREHLDETQFYTESSPLFGASREICKILTYSPINRINDIPMRRDIKRHEDDEFEKTLNDTHLSSKLIRGHFDNLYSV